MDHRTEILRSGKVRASPTIDPSEALAESEECVLRTS
jgi:hypothetical protein